MRNKKNVYLSKIKTPVGLIPILANFQTVNRKVTVYSADKDEGNGTSSIFFIIRKKDADKLKELGYSINSVDVLPGWYPRVFHGNVLDIANH